MKFCPKWTASWTYFIRKSGDIPTRSIAVSLQL